MEESFGPVLSQLRFDSGWWLGRDADSSKEKACKQSPCPQFLPRVFQKRADILNDFDKIRTSILRSLTNLSIIIVKRPLLNIRKYRYVQQFKDWAAYLELYGDLFLMFPTFVVGVASHSLGCYSKPAMRSRMYSATCTRFETKGHSN